MCTICSSLLFPLFYSWQPITTAMQCLCLPVFPEYDSHIQKRRSERGVFRCLLILSLMINMHIIFHNNTILNETYFMACCFYDFGKSACRWLAYVRSRLCWLCLFERTPSRGSSTSANRDFGAMLYL